MRVKGAVDRILSIVSIQDAFEQPMYHLKTNFDIFVNRGRILRLRLRMTGGGRILRLRLRMTGGGRIPRVRSE